MTSEISDDRIPSVEILVQVEALLPVGVEVDVEKPPGVGLKPSLELGLLRSEVLAARGYTEVDGDGATVHPCRSSRNSDANREDRRAAGTSPAAF